MTYLRTEAPGTIDSVALQAGTFVAESTSSPVDPQPAFLEHAFRNTIEQVVRWGAAQRTRVNVAVEGLEHYFDDPNGPEARASIAAFEAAMRERGYGVSHRILPPNGHRTFVTTVQFQVSFDQPRDSTATGGPTITFSRLPSAREARQLAQGARGGLSDSERAVRDAVIDALLAAGNRISRAASGPGTEVTFAAGVLSRIQDDDLRGEAESMITEALAARGYDVSFRRVTSDHPYADYVAGTMRLASDAPTDSAAQLPPEIRLALGTVPDAQWAARVPTRRELAERLISARAITPPTAGALRPPGPGGALRRP